MVWNHTWDVLQETCLRGNSPETLCLRSWMSLLLSELQPLAEAERILSIDDIQLKTRLNQPIQATGVNTL